MEGVPFHRFYLGMLPTNLTHLQLPCPLTAALSLSLDSSSLVISLYFKMYDVMQYDTLGYHDYEEKSQDEQMDDPWSTME